MQVPASTAIVPGDVLEVDRSIVSSDTERFTRMKVMTTAGLKNGWFGVAQGTKATTDGDYASVTEMDIVFVSSDVEALLGNLTGSGSIGLTLIGTNAAASLIDTATAGAKVIGVTKTATESAKARIAFDGWNGFGVQA